MRRKLSGILFGLLFLVGFGILAYCLVFICCVSSHVHVIGNGFVLSLYFRFLWIFGLSVLGCEYEAAVAYGNDHAKHQCQKSFFISTFHGFLPPLHPKHSLSVLIILKRCGTAAFLFFPPRSPNPARWHSACCKYLR